LALLINVKQDSVCLQEWQYERSFFVTKKTKNKLTRPINADNLQLCLAVLKKTSTAKQSCKFPVIGDVEPVEKPQNLLK